MLDKTCDAPVYGWGEPIGLPDLHQNSIHWQVPQSAFFAWMIHGDGLAGQADAFALNSDFSVATAIYSPDFKWIPDPFEGLQISKLRFLLNDTAFQSLTANIWVSNADNGPDSLVWSKVVTGYIAGEWIEIPVDTTIIMHDGKRYYRDEIGRKAMLPITT